MVKQGVPVRWLWRYCLTALPALITLAGWQLAAWVYITFDCRGSIKSMAPCFIGSFNVLPWLGLGLFWCQLLFWLLAPVSLILLLFTAIRHVMAWQNKT